VQANITAGGQTERQTLWVRPIILNGGFEKIGSGGRPSDWSYQKPEQISAENVEGETCLKLQGKSDGFVEADQPVSLIPGRTYEARCRMKRTAGAAYRATAAVVLFLKASGERAYDLKKLTTNPDDQWNDYGVTFTPGDDFARSSVYLYNVNSAATVWYDAVSVRPVKPAK
jgi:hypothetical protein